MNSPLFGAIILPASEQALVESFLAKMAEKVKTDSLCCEFHAAIKVIESVGPPMDSLATVLDNRAGEGGMKARDSIIMLAYFLDRIGCPKVPKEYSRAFDVSRIDSVEEWTGFILSQLVLAMVPILGIVGSNDLAQLLASYYFFVQDQAKEIFNAPTV